MNAFEVVQPRPVRGGWSLRGYKGKGGGGGARQPVEAADSLHSTSYARVLDLLSEGEIAGLVNGLQSIYLNNTPLANADGSFNFAGVTADFRAGFQTQDPIPGFPSAESPAAVGVELKAATPWVRSILNRNLSAVRVTLGVDGLSKANTENGDISGHTVNYAIDLQTDGGAWVEVLAAAFTGKTTQQYRRTHRIDLPTAVTSWTLRVRRVTPNANSNTVADTTVIESITEVIDAKLRYPMSALVGLQVDASQFRGSVPTRAYHCRGRIIRVPSNYDPVMRSYAGIWDGTFKSAYSNNPAWVFYDLATNDRYGLGKRIPAGWINKWSLYQIGVYCDGMVSNGRGGVEPRFTCNAYLQSRGDATRVLQDLCSIFRGMVYWAAGAAVPVADMPRDPAVTYSQADVIDGRFSYSGSRLKDRHTVALVSYNDMTDFGRQKVFPYQGDAAVARYGIRKVEISAFGCTSEAQAQRVGQWAVLTAQRETRSVSFSLGLKGTLCSPGQVIEIADSAFAGRRMGGLVKSATGAKVVLDAPVTARAGDSITVMLPSGVAQSRRIAYLEMIDGAQHVSVNPAFDAAPVTESSWAISTANVATQLFTVLSVTEGTGPGLTFDVSAIQHEPGKFAAIDQGALLPERPVSVVPAQVLPTPIGVTVGAHSVTVGDGTISTTVTASWQAVAGAAFYDVEWSRSQSDWVRMPRTALTVVDIPNAYTGDYLVRVRAISAIDTVSAWGYSAATPVAATALPPRNYDTFVVAEQLNGVRQYRFAYTTQMPPADLAGAEIRYMAGSPANIDWQQMRPLDDGGYYTNSFESSKPEAGLWTFALRARNRSSILSEGMLIWRGELMLNMADVAPDLTPPPEVTGLAAVGMFSSVQVDWDAASYNQGHGHARTAIYAAQGEDATFDQAEQVAEAYGGPVSFASDPATTWRVWAKHQTVDGVLSAEPAGPVLVATAMDPGGLLDVLQGAIGRPQLTPEFSGEISEQQERTEELEATARSLRSDIEAEGALADLLNEWTSRAKLREVKKVVAGIDGTLQGTWAVEMELDAFGNKVAGGFGLVGRAGETGARLDFSVLANRFVIASPAGTGIEPVTPFIVVTVPEVIDGQEIPVGVYMEGAYIKAASIGRAQIALASIDDARITTLSASKLRSGSIEIGNYIQSTNFAEGESGWRITGDGRAEFSGVVVRGAVYATEGSIGGITIKGGGLNAGAYSGYSWPAGNGTGFHLGPGGLLMGNRSVDRYFQIDANTGNVYAPGFRIVDGNASFSGDIDGASGTFRGTLTAQNVVTTGNLQYNSATGIVNASQMSLLHWFEFSWPGDIITLTVPAADAASITSVFFSYEQIIPNQDADILFKLDGVAVFTKTFIGDGDAYANYFPGQMETMQIINVPFAFSGNGSARTLAIEVRPRGGHGSIYFYARFRSITANTSKR